MSWRPFFHRATAIVRRFTAMRAVEVGALQAAPFLGAVIAGAGSSWTEIARLALLLGASLALTAHVFALNDWAGQAADANDRQRGRRLFGQRNIRRRDVAGLAVVMLAVAAVALAFLGQRALFFGGAIAALSFLYSCAPFGGKGTPVCGTLIHIVGGALHFLLGYSLASPVDARGVAISLFFGLVFAGGHLNQEVRDHDTDRRNAIRTNAVVFGPRHAFVASLIVFMAAYAVLVALAAVGMLPRVLLWCALIWPWHLAWSRRAIQSGLGFDTACWMQRRYRFLFAIVGLAMFATAGMPRPGSSFPDSVLARLVRNVAQIYGSSGR